MFKIVLLPVLRLAFFFLRMYEAKSQLGQY